MEDFSGLNQSSILLDNPEPRTGYTGRPQNTLTVPQLSQTTTSGRRNSPQHIRPQSSQTTRTESPSRDSPSRRMLSNQRYILGKPIQHFTRPSPSFLSRTDREFDQREKKAKQATTCYVGMSAPKGFTEDLKLKWAKPDASFRSSTPRLLAKKNTAVESPGPGAYTNTDITHMRQRSSSVCRHSSPTSKRPRASSRNSLRSESSGRCSTPPSCHSSTPGGAGWRGSSAFMSTSPRFTRSSPAIDTPGPGTYTHCSPLGSRSRSTSRRNPPATSHITVGHNQAESQHSNNHNIHTPSFGGTAPRPCLHRATQDSANTPGPAEYNVDAFSTASSLHKGLHSVFRSQSPRLAGGPRTEHIATPGPGAYTVTDTTPKSSPHPGHTFRSRSARLCAITPKTVDTPGPGAYQTIPALSTKGTPKGTNVGFGSGSARECLRLKNLQETPDPGFYNVP